MNGPDLTRRLRLATKRGWDFEIWSGKGSHLHVKLNGVGTIVPQHRQDLPAGTFKSILKALRITQRDLEV